MGLTVSRKTHGNLAVGRKNWKILTVCLKNIFTVKKIVAKVKVSRSLNKIPILCLV